MCSKPEILLEPFAKAGADEIIIHVELGDKVPFLIDTIKSFGKKVGLAINPSTAIAIVQPYLNLMACPPSALVVNKDVAFVITL